MRDQLTKNGNIFKKFCNKMLIVNSNTGYSLPVGVVLVICVDCTSRGRVGEVTAFFVSGVAGESTPLLRRFVSKILNYSFLKFVELGY